MKKFLLAITVLLSLAMSITVSAKESEKLNYSSVLLSDKLYTVVSIKDGKYTTALNVYDTEALQVNLNTPSYTSYMYIKFRQTVPESLELLVADEAGNHTTRTVYPKYLHELIEIDSELSLIEITSPEKFAVCELELYGEGELPPNVQKWEKSFDECDILVISTHADDDTLFFGALTAENIAKGRLVQTAFVSDHPNEPHRLNELLDGQWALGVTAYPIIGNFRDYYSTTLQKALTQYNSDEICEFLVECIRRTKPGVVVTHDEKGEYGHGAHMLVSSVSKSAFEYAKDISKYPELVKEYGTHAAQRLIIHLCKENPIKLDVHKTYDELGGKSPFDIAKEAYSCHISQQKWDFKVTDKGTDDCSSFGVFAGNTAATDNDIMSTLKTITPDIMSEALTHFSGKTEPSHKSTHIDTTVSLDDDGKASNDTIFNCVIIALLTILIFAFSETVKRIRIYK